MIRAKEGLSSSHDNFLYVPLPLRRRVLRYPLQNLRYLPWPSPNPHRLGSLYLLLSQKPLRRCRIRFMLRTAHLLHLASTQASLPKPEVLLPRTLASPWTGLTPASYRELVAQLRHFNLLGVMTSELLDARGSRLSNPRENQYSKMCANDAEKLKELEKEKSRLKTVVFDLTLG